MSPDDENVDQEQSSPLVEVFAASHLEADLVCSALKANGIPAVLAGEGLSGSYPLTVGAMGEGRVLVPEERGQEALEVIGTLEEVEDEDPDVLAAPRSPNATWFIALALVVGLVLLLLNDSLRGV